MATQITEKYDSGSTSGSQYTWVTLNFTIKMSGQQLWGIAYKAYATGSHTFTLSYNGTILWNSTQTISATGWNYIYFGSGIGVSASTGYSLRVDRPSSCLYRGGSDMYDGTFWKTDSEQLSNGNTYSETPDMGLIYAEDVTNYKTSGSAIFTTDSVQEITEYGTSVINWNESTPQGTAVTVYAACTEGVPTDTDYIVCENKGPLPCCADGADLSGSVLYIKAVLETTDDTLTPTISNITVNIEDKKYKTYVSQPRNGIYKVYCDLTDKIHGITVLNKATSRLRFAIGDSKMPVFSVHTYIKGLVSYDSTTYLYEKESFPAFSFRITESDTSNFWTAINAGDISESTTFAFTHGTVTETTNILLT